ncbi:hypothetical protein [Streptomyces sp. NPDC050355]|uniref:hypothetical protein n=1 Tax=Streptomyces sp. NPDC050355 TaxID=3365609 RepID=UPI003796961B
MITVEGMSMLRRPATGHAAAALTVGRPAVPARAAVHAGVPAFTSSSAHGTVTLLGGAA